MAPALRQRRRWLLRLVAAAAGAYVVVHAALGASGGGAGSPMAPSRGVATYFCGTRRAGDMSNSYSAAWLATKGRFLLGVPLAMPFLKQRLTPAAMRRVRSSGVFFLRPARTGAQSFSRASTSARRSRGAP